MAYPRGSEWRKWDLHIHTPESLVHNYQGTKEAAWGRFIAELESLPSEFKVLGINDYLFLDGYRRVREEKNAGRLANIDLILPVIELRLDKFGGSESKLSRVNFHVIFSDELDPDVIEQQFLSALTSKYSLTPQATASGGHWGGVITKQSLTDLGQMIIDSVPPDRKHQYATPLIEGFNNINLNLEDISSILKGSYLAGKHLTAVGKTEWWDIKWNEQSIADKKTIINKADWVFISSASPSEWEKAKRHLTTSQVNDRLLDCSDAHEFSDSKEKDRIGNCFTWIKADPTFEGLQIALLEPNERVFVGDYPVKLQHKESNTTKYLQRLEIRKKSSADFPEHWFDDTELELNSDLIAVIGNKGSGKSALADILGLVGNTSNGSHFSFLNDTRFCKPPDNKAKHFEARIVWESSNNRLVNLSDSIDGVATETVKYIPQGMFDDICGEVPGGKKGKFDLEIEQVIFSRLAIADRLGQPTLASLIEYKTQETKDAIGDLRRDLQSINESIVLLEEELSIDYKRRLEGQFKQKQDELKAHENQKPAEVVSPSNQSPDPELTRQTLEVDAQQKDLDQKIQDAEGRQKGIATRLAILDKFTRRLDNLKQNVDRFLLDSSSDADTLGINLAEIVQFQIVEAPLVLQRQLLESEKQFVDQQLDSQSDSSLLNERMRIREKISLLRQQLDEPTRLFNEYQQSLEEYERKKSTIIGTPQQVDTLAYFDHKIKATETAGERLSNAQEERKKITSRIYDRIEFLAGEYRKLYAPVQAFIDTNPVAKGKLALNFDVSIVDVELPSRFFEWISRQASGSFRGSEEGAKQLQKVIASNSFDNFDGVTHFLDDLLQYLTTDKRSTSSTPVDIKKQMRDGKSVESFYNYLFSLEYLQPRYVLKMGDKELSQLSPGEKGALLLIFYLLVDKGDIPLVIDQPEENLDNQTVFELLVEAIKFAKKRRQILVVTHNPNLAVVCDAEQIICAEIDKANGNKVSYIAGSIENPTINKKIVDILEGTKPAFDNRKLKYHN